MSELTAKLTISDGREYDLNVHRAELGYDVVDVQSLTSQNYSHSTRV